MPKPGWCSSGLQMLTFNSPSALQIILERRKLLAGLSSHMANSRWSTPLTTFNVHILSLHNSRFLMAKKAYVVRSSDFKITETEKSERAVKRPVLIRTITSGEIGQRALQPPGFVENVFCIMAALTVAKKDCFSAVCTVYTLSLCYHVR